MKFMILLAATIVLCSCNDGHQTKASSQNRYLSVEDTLHLPFDTNRVLALYDVPIRVFSLNAPEDLDTFVLSDLMYACDCPRWATEKAKKDLENFNPLDANKNADREVFYLERGTLDFQLPEKFTALRNHIRFYGKIRTNNGLPETEGFTDPHPPAGPVLTVYGYEVLLPAYIYGPLVHVPDPTGKRPDWAQYDMTVLRVTEQNYFPQK